MSRWLRAGIWLAVLAGGLVLALITTEFEMGVPPTNLGLAALAAVVAALTALALLPERPRGRAARLALPAGLIALALVAGQDFLRPGISWGHDIGYHAWALFTTWRSVLDGDPWPRWNPYLALGMPLLQFYCPAGYAAAWPVQALGASAVDALRFLVIGSQLLCAAATYGAVRWAGGSRPAGLLAAAALALAPYHLMDQTFRLALGENLAFVVLPLLVVAAWKVSRGERGAAPWVLGGCTGLLLLIHVLSVITIALAAAPLFLWGLIWWRGRSGRRLPALGTLALCVLLTVGAMAAWWLPVMVEQESTAVSRLSRPGRSISPLAATWREPVQRRAWPRYGVRHRLTETDDPGRDMPMYMGCALLALALLALFAPWREPPLPALPDPSTELRSAPARGPPSPRPWAIVGLLVLLLALWPFARLLDGVPLIGRIMFPWRLYAPATVLLVLASAFALDRWSAGRPRLAVVLLGAALVALALDAAPYLGAARRFPPHEGQGFVVFSGDQLLPTHVPRGEFVRVEGAPLPPTDYGFRVAKSRRVFPEYMSIPLREQYGKYSKPPDVERSQRFGASARYDMWSGRHTPLDPEPLVGFKRSGGRYRGLPEAEVDIRPERVTIRLPEGLPEGNVRLTMGWFPGWQVRVDGGPWSPALRSRSLLAAPAPAGAREVELRYSAWHPRHRPIGMAISLLTLVGIGLLRRRLYGDSAS